MKNELTYTKMGDYAYPNLTLQNPQPKSLGKYGRMRLDFMLKHRRGTYTTILTEGRLNEYLHEIDKQAVELMEATMARLTEERGITEELKVADQMRWVQEMNNARASVEEIILREVVYR